jgi:hypothetical protein
MGSHIASQGFDQGEVFLIHANTWGWVSLSPTYIILEITRVEPPIPNHDPLGIYMAPYFQ